MTVLYRCPTPTNYLCACGKAARALKATGIDFDQVRVSYRKSERAEIEDLTKQRRVPVLVHGNEVIHDSNRIVQYLDALPSPSSDG
jgi:glutathione S-transferase